MKETMLYLLCGAAILLLHWKLPELVRTGIAYFLAGMKIGDFVRWLIKGVSSRD